MGQGRFSQSTFSGSAFSSCFGGSAAARPTEEGGGEGEGRGGGGAAAWLTEDPIGEKAKELTPFCYPSASVRALERGKGFGLGLRLRLTERFWEGFLSAPCESLPPSHMDGASCPDADPNPKLRLTSPSRASQSFLSRRNYQIRCFRSPRIRIHVSTI